MGNGNGFQVTHYYDFAPWFDMENGNGFEITHHGIRDQLRDEHTDKV